MPKRLLLAAEILRDVARTVNEADRPLLEAAADELADRAAAVCSAEGMALEAVQSVQTSHASLQRLAALGSGRALGMELLVH